MVGPAVALARPRGGKALLLSLVSTRPLQGRWQWSEDGEGWRLVVELQERDGRE